MARKPKNEEPIEEETSEPREDGVVDQSEIQDERSTSDVQRSTFNEAFDPLTKIDPPIDPPAPIDPTALSDLPKFDNNDRVWVVLADGSSVPGRAMFANEDGTIDLIADYQGGLVITSSPRDDTGKKPDSWRPYTSPFKANA